MNKKKNNSQHGVGSDNHVTTDFFQVVGKMDACFVISTPSGECERSCSLQFCSPVDFFCTCKWGREKQLFLT